MNSFIQITRHLYEEPHHLNLVIISGNGSAQGALEFYSNANHVTELGKKLSGFPSHQRENHLFELGSERPEDRFAFYLRLRAEALNSKQKCLVHIRLNNNEKYDHTNRCEDPQLTDFSIRTGSDALRKFGEMLTSFGALEHQRLFWSPKLSLLDNELLFRDRRTGDNIEAAFRSLPRLLSRSHS